MVPKLEVINRISQANPINGVAHTTEVFADDPHRRRHIRPEQHAELLNAARTACHEALEGLLFDVPDTASLLPSHYLLIEELIGKMQNAALSVSPTLRPFMQSVYRAQLAQVKELQQ